MLLLFTFYRLRNSTWYEIRLLRTPQPAAEVVKKVIFNYIVNKENSDLKCR